jgi:DNA-binding XRE family transcriptional regulator
MDDKSMQAWINEQLTAGAPPRTIVAVGRPKETTSPTTYRAQFFKRVRAARALYTENPPEMAKALGVPRDTYYRYEERTMLPHHLIPKFCEITGVTVEWLMRGPAAAQAMQHQKSASTG